MTLPNDASDRTAQGAWVRADRHLSQDRLEARRLARRRLGQPRLAGAPSTDRGIPSGRRGNIAFRTALLSAVECFASAGSAAGRGGQLEVPDLVGAGSGTGRTGCPCGSASRRRRSGRCRPRCPVTWCDSSGSATYSRCLLPAAVLLDRLLQQLFLVLLAPPARGHVQRDAVRLHRRLGLRPGSPSAASGSSFAIPGRSSVERRRLSGRTPSSGRPCRGRLAVRQLDRAGYRREPSRNRSTGGRRPASCRRPGRS